MQSNQALTRAGRIAAKATIAFQLTTAIALLLADRLGLNALWEIEGGVVASLFVMPAAFLLSVLAHWRGKTSAGPYLVPLAFGLGAAWWSAKGVYGSLGVEYAALADIFAGANALAALGLACVGAAWTAGLRALLERGSSRRGYALLSACLLLIGSRAFLYGDGLGVMGCKCMLNTLLEEASLRLAYASRAAWLGGGVLAAGALLYVVRTRRAPPKALLLWLLVYGGTVAATEAHFTQLVFEPLATVPLPAGVQLPITAP